MCFQNDFFHKPSAPYHCEAIAFNMAWRTHVLQMIVFTMPARGLIQTEQFFNMPVLQMSIFKVPALGLIQTELFLICLGEHMFSTI